MKEITAVEKLIEALEEESLEVVYGFVMGLTHPLPTERFEEIVNSFDDEVGLVCKFRKAENFPGIRNFADLDFRTKVSVVALILEILDCETNDEDLDIPETNPSYVESLKADIMETVLEYLDEHLEEHSASRFAEGKEEDKTSFIPQTGYSAPLENDLKDEWHYKITTYPGSDSIDEELNEMFEGFEEQMKDSQTEKEWQELFIFAQNLVKGLG